MVIAKKPDIRALRGFVSEGSDPQSLAPPYRPLDGAARAGRDRSFRSCSSGRARRRGFTLVELFIVVVIVGIMATLATYGLRKYILQAKTAEAVHMISAIKAGQEAFFDETFRYFDVSRSMANLYPSAGDWDQKIQWGGIPEEAERWAMIGITPEAPVQFRYACVAGLPSEMPTDATFEETGLSYNLAAVTTPSHWYLVKAVAVLDGSTRTVFAGSSFTNEIYSQTVGD